MGANTQIEWCDATLNLWWGCTKVSAGCKNCYAEGLADKRLGRSNWGPTGTRQEVKSWRSTLGKIARNAKFFVQCAGCGRRGDSRSWEQDIRANHPNAVTCCPDRDLKPARPRVFVQSMSDTFEGPETMGGTNSENWQTVSRLRTELYQAIVKHEELDFLVLTKRPENVMRQWADAVGVGELLPKLDFPNHLWLGTSVEDQATADTRIPHLMEIPAKVRFLSMEPLLGPVDLTCIRVPAKDGFYEYDALRGTADGIRFLPLIGWVIVGGESGKNARLMHPDWVRSIRDQCVAAGVPFFFKQWGEWVDEMHLEANPHAQETSDVFVNLIRDGERVVDYTGCYMCKAGKKKAGRVLDGRTWDGFPVVKS